MQPHDHPSLNLAAYLLRKPGKQAVNMVGLRRQTRYWRLFALLLGLMLVLASGIDGSATASSNPPTPQTFVVTNTSDSGSGSLRQAILDANANAGADTIEFDLSGCPCFISLTSGQLEINDDVSINGPGYQELLLGSGNSSRVLLINTGEVNISSLFIGYGVAPEFEAGGGGILNWSSSPLTLTDVVMGYNTTPNDVGYVGGAIANFVGPLILNRVFLGYNGAYVGGGVYSEPGTVTITDSTFLNNISTEGGSALAFGNPFCAGRQVLCSFEALKSRQQPGGEPTLTNVTLAANYVLNDSSFLGGAGVLALLPTHLTHVTIVDNYATLGGAVSSFDSLTLASTLISNSYGFSNYCYGSIVDDGGNLSWPDTSCPGLNSDPLLGSFDYHGGSSSSIVPLPLFSLRPNSPARNAISIGTNGCGDVVTTDQRGLPRPQDGACDIGAYEAQIACAVAEDGVYSIGDVQFHIQVGGVGDTDCIEVKPYPTSHPDATPGLQTGAYWHIDATNSSSDPASGCTIDLTITTPFVPTEQDKLCRYTGTTWDCMADGFDAGLQTITRQGVTEFSEWAAGNTVPLAVSLSQVGSAPQSGALWPLGVAMLLLGVLSWWVFTRRSRLHTSAS